MESTLLELFKQTPALGVLAWALWTFLVHLERRDKLHAETLRTINDNSNALNERNITALDRNAEMFGRVASVVEPRESCRQPTAESR